MSNDRPRALIVRVDQWMCSIDLQYVVETLRTLPIEAVPGAPAFVLGAAILRGAPVPVVDLGALLGSPCSLRTRLVSLGIGARRVALAVDAVVEVRTLDPSLVRELPPLLRDAERGLVERLGALDGELLLALRASRILPEEAPSAPLRVTP